MRSFDLFPKRSLSHKIIIVMIIISVIGFIFPAFLMRYGFSGYFFYTGQYDQFLLQVVLFQFLHGGILHLLMNSYFLFSAGPILEARMSDNRFLAFFAGSSVWIAIVLLIFAPTVVTVGISGFCTALLSYLWIDLSKTRHPMANQIFQMLIVNIVIGLIPGISLVGHVAGALYGLIWWWAFRTWKK